MSTAQPATTPAPKRKLLSAVKTGRLAKPMRILLYGVEKIGKSTFAAESPTPIFIGAEDGTAMLDVARFPQPESFADVTAMIAELSAEPHEYKTLVIDTLDWLEPMLWAFICARDKKVDVESYGYGKGYTAALDEWRVLLAQLERLRAARSMHIILLAHSWVKPYKNPVGDDYDRFEMKLNAKAGGLVKEWCDAVLFARHETFAVKSADTGRVRGFDDGARVIHTQPRAAWDAGNRFGLPEKLPLSWEEFSAAVVAGAPGTVEQMLAEVNALMGKVDSETRTKAEAWLATNGNAKDAGKLAQMADRLRAKLSNSNETKEKSQ